MSEESPYKIMPRRKRWVEGLAGGRICLWSFTMDDMSRITEYSTRPPEDPRGGIDTGEMALWQIALACYTGDGEKAKRLWGDLQVHEIRQMDGADWTKLMLAINELNGNSATAEEVQRDFLPAAGPSS